MSTSRGVSVGTAVTLLIAVAACDGSAASDSSKSEATGGSAAAGGTGGRGGWSIGAGANGQARAGNGGDLIGGSGGGSGVPTGSGGSGGAPGGTGGSGVVTGGTVATGGVAGGTGGSGGVTGGTGGSGGRRGVTRGSAGAAGARGGASGASAGGGGATVGGTGGSAGGVGDEDGGMGGGVVTGPCDIYAAAATPCVAAYSMVRRLSSTYAGPLYQVRSESGEQNTGTGGTTHDIGTTEDGFADASTQDTVCFGTICTVSLLYDQSGHGNDLPVAKGGMGVVGPEAALDDFESVAGAGPLRAGGHDVYSLYMDARQGYRSPVGVVGNGMPLGTEAQGIYLLADGTRPGEACCWDFGNVSTDPTEFHATNAMFFGVGVRDMGADSGPWFVADFPNGLWSGGSNPGSPGCPDLGCLPNVNNPSLPVPFALGVLRTSPDGYSLEMADVQTATVLTTAYEGESPGVMDNQGGIVLGVDGENANLSWGTFYEGAIVAGYPSNDTGIAVMRNIQAVGYGQ